MWSALGESGSSGFQAGKVGGLKSGGLHQQPYLLVGKALRLAWFQTYCTASFVGL